MKRWSKNRRLQVLRRGAAASDYILVIATTFPILLVIATNGKKIMRLVWEMLAVQVSGPFL